MFHINSLVPEFWCSDFDESLQFYTEIRGFKGPAARQSPRRLFGAGGAQIMIARWEQDGSWEPAPLEKPYGRGVNFFMLDDDVRDMCEGVLSAGGKPFVELHTR